MMCDETCRFAPFCHVEPSQRSPDDCPNAWKLEDLYEDAKDIQREMERMDKVDGFED